MTTGEIANGRSMTASQRPTLPRKRPRTSASAVITPKTVFSGTAISAISTVSQNAWMAAGVVIESHTKPDAVLERPVEDDRRPARAAARRGTRARGRAGRSGRGGQRSSAASLRVRSGRGRGSRAARRARARAARPTPRRPTSIASLSMRPKMNTEATSVLNGMLPAMSTTEPNSPTARANASAAPERIAGHEVGQDDPPEDRRRARAERHRRLLHLAVELDQHRLHRADDERQRHEQQRHEDRPARADDVDPGRAVRAVEGEQRDAGDDRRQRERQVDERVDERRGRGSGRGRAPTRRASRRPR